MRTYNVTMGEKYYKSITTRMTVTVKDNEHPREKAINFLCELGYRVYKDDITILKIERVRWNKNVKQ